MEGRLAEDSPLVAHATVLDNLNLALQLRATPESTTVLRYLAASKISPGLVRRLLRRIALPALYDVKVAE
jgi:hypothetical protein